MYLGVILKSIHHAHRKSWWKSIHHTSCKLITKLLYRSRRSHMFFKIGLFTNFAVFTGKHLCWSLILIKLQAWRTTTLLNRDSNTVVFLWILRNFYEQPFLQNTGGCFCTSGTTVLENIVRRNGKKHSQVGVSNSSGSQFMKIIIFTWILYFV